MTNKNKNFLGIPIDGDIQERNPATQRPIEDLEPLIRAVLDDPLFTAIGWRQSTPYFNDGEPCEFSVDHPYFLTVDDKLEACAEDCTEAAADPKHECSDYDADDVEDSYSVAYGSHPTLGGYDGWGKDAVFKSNYPEQFKKAKALSEAMGSDAFDDVLLRAFGDHAIIKLTREKITVDFYEHD